MSKVVQRDIDLKDHHGASAKALGYSLWEYTGKSWALKKDCSAVGAIRAGAPTIEGGFRGQLRIVPSIQS